MPRKTKDQTISELQESISVYQSEIEKLSRENKELVDTEEGTFLQSPTYRQMTEQIRFLDNLSKLSENNLSLARKQREELREMLRKTETGEKETASEELLRVREENALLKGKLKTAEETIEAYKKELAAIQEKYAQAVSEGGKNNG
ncbi:MAG: hypothetical protein ACI4FX_05225 [Agathobacter sp.]